jgi:hypothetical protein
MTDQDVLVEELLEQHTPLRLDVDPDWEDVLGRSAITGGRSPGLGSPGHSHRRPRAMALALVLLVLLGTGVAVALGGGPWWQGAPPPSNPGPVQFELAKDADSEFPPNPDSSHAVTVANEGAIELVAAPVAEDGYCLAVVADGMPVGGHSCEYQATEDARSLALATPPSGTAFWVVYGRIIEPEAAALDLTPAAGVPLLVPLHYQGFFLTRVPKDRWAALSDGAGKARILDSSGRTLETRCVSWGPAPGTTGAGQAKYGLWGEKTTPCRPNRQMWMISTEEATKLVTLPLVADWENYAAPGESVALWRAPQEDGETCILEARGSATPTYPGPGRSPVLAPGQSPRPGWNPFWGVICDREAALLQTPEGKPIAVTVGGGQSSGDPAYWHFEGHVNPSSSVSRMVLESGNATTAFAYASGWFLGQLPQSNSLKEFPQGGPYVLVGYDSNGKEVARVDLRAAWEAEKRQGLASIRSR